MYLPHILIFQDIRRQRKGEEELRENKQREVVGDLNKAAVQASNLKPN